MALDTIRARYWITQLSSVEDMTGRVPGASRRVRDNEAQTCDRSRARISESTTTNRINLAANVCDTRVIVL